VPEWVVVIVLAVVFTSVISVTQGLYWAWVARQERQQQELVRRLGGQGSDQGLQESIFIQEEDDAAAAALGSAGEALRKHLLMADSGLSVSAFFLRCGALGAVGMVVGGLAIGLPGMAIGLGLAYVPWVIIKRQATRRGEAMVQQLPDSLELMSRSLQAGLGLNDAFRLVAEEMPMPVAGEFGRVFEEVRFGRDYREAFQNMLDRNPDVFDMRLMVSSVLLQRETGGNLIEILENIAETIRGRFVFHAKVKAMTAEARISAVILGGLPLAVISFLGISNPEYLMPLVEDWKGNMLLAICATMYISGILIMRDLSIVDV
jgi:tight adherence protein B